MRLQSRVARLGLSAGATAVAAAIAAVSPGGAGAGHTSCTAPPASGAASRALEQALASGRDLWGEELLARRDGASLEGVRKLLPPLFYARGRGGRLLTASGAYYLVFAMPRSLSSG